MSLRMPRKLQTGAVDSVAAVQYEILQAKAATLERLGGRLQEALRALESFDAAPPPDGGPARQELVAAAGEALWYYVVQREVCGFRDAEQVMRELRVPREVRLRMGIAPKRPGGGGPAVRSAPPAPGSR